MSYRALMFVAVIALAAPLAAQDAAVVVDPGMTRAEVIDRLGKPLNERKTGDHTYMFYRNGCEKTCGMNDLVVLDDGKVADAIFRSPGRRYSGSSSSPNATRASRSAHSDGSTAAVETVRRAKRGGIVLAKPGDGAGTTAAPATVTGVEVVPAEGGAPNGAMPAPPAARAAPPVTAPSSNAVVIGGGNSPQVIDGGGNSPQVGSPEPRAVRQGPVGANGQRVILPVPLPGAKVNPADSIRALTPDRPTALPGAKLNPADSIRAEQIRRQQADTTRKP